MEKRKRDMGHVQGIIMEQKKDVVMLARNHILFELMKDLTFTKYWVNWTRSYLSKQLIDAIDIYY